MNALGALAVGVPVTVLIPLLGWLYGWQGALVVVALGAVPAYILGVWIARRQSSTRVLCCVRTPHYCHEMP